MKVYSHLEFNNFLKTSDGERIFYSHNFEDITEDIIVLNYGLVCSNHHWKPQIAFLLNSGRPFLIYDFRGHFKSSGSDNIEAITFKQMAKDLEELLEHLKIKSAHIVGHSMGVNVCLEHHRLFPQKVKSLTLISGTVLPVNNIMFDSNVMDFIIPPFEVGIKKFKKAIDLIWETGNYNPLARLVVYTGGFNTRQVDMDFVDVYMNKISQLPAPLFFQLFSQMREHDILPYLEKIQIPTLVMGGDKDQIIPFHMQQFIHHKINGSKLYLIKEGSHVPQIDFPDLINERLMLFITKEV